MALPDGSAMVLSRRIEVLQTSLATMWGFECFRGGRKSGPACGWPSPTPAPATWRSMSATIRPRSRRRRERPSKPALGLGGRPLPVHEPGPRQRRRRHRRRARRRGSWPDPPTPPPLTPWSPLGEPLAVMVADCVPVVLVGDRAGGDGPVLAVVHAGRPGVAVRRRPGRRGAHARTGRGRSSAPGSARPSAGAATRSPKTCGPTSPRVVPAAWCTTSRGTPGLDLPAGVRSQLRGRRRRGRILRRLHPRRRRPVLLPPRPGHRAVRRTGVDRRRTG